MSSEATIDTSTNAQPQSNGDAEPKNDSEPELVRVIELRTHGVSGTTPESILDVPRIAWCDGTDRARFFCAADYLSRPVHAGPELVVDGCDVPRARLGYHWGRMTSGGWRQAMWAILIPFALSNMAIWMLPPKTTSVWSGRAVRIARASVRVAGLLLTVLFMSQAVVIVVDLLAAQCLAATSSCLDSSAQANWFRQQPVWRALAAAALLVIPAVMVGLITKDAIRDTPPNPDTEDASRDTNESDTAGPDPAIPGLRPRLADDDYYAFSNSRSALRTLHGIAAFAAATMLLTGGLSPATWSVRTATPWLIGAALLLVAIVCTAVLDDPNGTGGEYRFGGHSLRKTFEGPRGMAEVAVAVIVLVAAAWLVLPDRFKDDSFGVALGRTTDALVGVFAALLLVWIALLLALFVATRLARRTFWRNYPKPYRPWLGGLHPAVFIALAVLVGSGFGVGATQAVQNCVTTGCRPQFTVPDNVAQLQQPAFYGAIARQWGILALVLLAVAVLVFVVYWGYLRWRSHFPAAELLQKDAAERSQEKPITPMSWFVARLNQWAHFIALGILVVAVGGLIAAPWTPNWLQVLGLSLLALALITLLGAIYNAYRRPDTAGRSLGVLWDLASFWPREGHPIVPPPYSRQAVKDLTDKTEKLLDSDQRALVVLCGHSQGSLLMYATVLRLKRKGVNLDRVALVTYGSQLQWAYGRAFPDYLSYTSHRAMLADLGGRWKNIIRFTDPVGGPVLSWGLAVDRGRISGTVPTLTPAVEWDETADASLTVGDCMVIGNEYWLPDPSCSDPTYPVRGHSDYPASSQWDRVIAQVYTEATSLRPAQRTQK